MSMTLFDPFADLAQFRRQFNRLMDSPHAPSTREVESSRSWIPAADLFEDEDILTVRMDLPEIDRETLDVQLSQDELRIAGERRWQKPERGACVHTERIYGQFARVFKLGVGVQPDGVEAAYKDGVLTIRLPKAEAVKPRRVAVRVEADPA